MLSHHTHSDYRAARSVHKHWTVRGQLEPVLCEPTFPLIERSPASSPQQKQQRALCKEKEKKNIPFMSHWVHAFKLMSKLGWFVNVFYKSVYLFFPTHPVRSEYLCVYLSLWLTVPVHSECRRASPSGGGQTTAKETKRNKKAWKGYNYNTTPPPTHSFR